MLINLVPRISLDHAYDHLVHFLSSKLLQHTFYQTFYHFKNTFISSIIVSLPLSPCSESSVVAHRYFVIAQEWSPGINLCSSKRKHVLLQFPAVLHAPESATTKNYFLLSLLVHSGSGVAVFQNFFTQLIAISVILLSSWLKKKKGVYV